MCDSFDFFYSIALAGGESTYIPNYDQIHSLYTGSACFEAATEQAMELCGEKALNTAKSEMKSLIKYLIATDKTMTKKLTANQVAWLSYAETSCDLETHESEEGAAYSAIKNYCLEARTNERISYLKWLINTP